jgi:hypothetical protein
MRRLLVPLVVLAVGGSASAQKAPKPAPAPAAPAPAPAPAAPAPAAPSEAQQAAGAEFQLGQEAQNGGDLDGALAHYEKAFELYPDPELQFLIGDVHRAKGDQTEDFAEYEKAIANFEKYLELAPQGRAADAARQRIDALKQGLANKAEADKQEAAEREAEAAAAKQAAEEAREADEARHGMQLALDLGLMAGTETGLSGLARMVAGGLVNWGRFGIEGHLGFAGFLRTRDATGIAAREITLLDLGARFAFRDTDRFVGPFVSAGGSFGLITGKPRERRLKDDATSCAGTSGNDCGFAIDKDLVGRVGFGWGFASSENTTVGLRADLAYMMFSVDDEQDTVPARQIEKPQGTFAILVGLSFMHWP